MYVDVFLIWRAVMTTTLYGEFARLLHLSAYGTMRHRRPGNRHLFCFPAWLCSATTSDGPCPVIPFDFDNQPPPGMDGLAGNQRRAARCDTSNNNWAYPSCQDPVSGAIGKWVPDIVTDWTSAPDGALGMNSSFTVAQGMDRWRPFSYFLSTHCFTFPPPSPPPPPPYTHTTT